MKPRSLLSLGAIALVFILGTTYLTFGVLRVEWFHHRLAATLTLRDSGGLQPHSPVLLSGIPVGEVSDVETVDRAVRISLRLEDTYRIPVDSTARIESLSALGEPYLEFTPAGLGGPYLHDGQQIDARRVQLPLSIAEMAAATTDLLGQTDPRAVSDLVHTFSEAFTGTESSLPQLNRAADLLAATLLRRIPQLRTMFTDLQTIGGDAAWVGPSLTATGPALSTFGERVHAVVDALEKLMRSKGFPDDYTGDTGLVPFLNQLADRLDRLAPELRPLVPVLAPLAASTTDALHTLDLGALISQALAATDDGAMRLQITVK